MLYPRKLNIYLRFQRLSAKFGERVANGNPGIFAYKPLRISADVRDLGVQRRPGTQRPRRYAESIVKTC